MPFKNLLFVLTLSAAVSTHAADETKLVEFKISGGQVVQCPVVGNDLPLPAKSGPYSMSHTTLTAGRDDTGRINVMIMFRINLRANWRGVLTRIVVEDVSNQTAVTVIDDKAPRIAYDRWDYNTPPVPVDKSATPWMFDGKMTTQVFRFTISAKDVPDVIFYQPVFHSIREKNQILSRLPQMPK